ncbi:MAG TPA: hypothetical protein VMY18_08005 [Acidobacteriota bacterium]|nr:hypothetical protein [Acidobacteriota bacterium]
MKRIRLIHWNKDEAEPRNKALERLQYEVEFEIPNGPQFFKQLRRNPPDAVVIDLTRLPSQGRDLAFGIRKAKSSRNVPLIFAGGAQSKVDRIRELLPDAVYTEWAQIGEALEKALSSPPENPVVPDSDFAGYSGTPLPKKLGIKANMKVGLLNPPEDFPQTLGSLPEAVVFRKNAKAGCDLLIWFVRSRSELAKRIRSIADRKDYRSAWIAWPKKSSGIQSDLTQQQVRESGLDHGLVDYKICAIDATWSGLLFTRRKK